MRSRTKKSSPPTFSARRRKTAQEERAETSWQTQGGTPEAAVASVVRVRSPTLALRRMLGAPHPSSLSLLHQTHLTCALGTTLGDSRTRTLCVSTGCTRIWLSLASTPLVARTQLLLVLLLLILCASFVPLRKDSRSKRFASTRVVIRRGQLSKHVQQCHCADRTTNYSISINNPPTPLT